MATPPRSFALTHAEVAELLRLPLVGTTQQRSRPSSAVQGSSTWAYLDVRTPEEFATGHVPGAYNIPYQLGDLAGLHPNPEFEGLVAAVFPLDAPLVLGCRSGGRAASAERALRNAGFTELRVHLGSLAGERDAFGRVKPGWVRAGYDVSEVAQPGRTHAELTAAAHGGKPTPSQS